MIHLRPHPENPGAVFFFRLDEGWFLPYNGDIWKE